MFDLLPTELWEYSLTDISRALSAAVDWKKPRDSIDIPALGSCIPARSARAALVDAIKAFELPAGARVGVPLYCCPVVSKSIVAAGCRPVFVDIDPLSFCISIGDLNRKNSLIDAVIAVHMFGNLCDMPGLQAVMQGKPVIEDCAQAIGCKLDGKMAGSFGDVGVFSFRSGKCLSVGEGGALFTVRPYLRSKIAALVSEAPTPSLKDECVHIVKTILRTMLRSSPLYGLIGSSLWRIYNRTTEFSSKIPLIMSQIYRADLANIKDRLTYIDSVISKNRMNADYYSSKLKLNPGMLISENPGQFSNRYHYPITFSSQQQRDFVASYLRKRGVDTSKPLDEIVDVASRYFGYSNDCPVSEDLSKRVLVIPNHHKIERSELDHIARCVNSAWAEITDARRRAVATSND